MARGLERTRAAAPGGFPLARLALLGGALLVAAAALLLLPRPVPGSDPTRPALRCVLVDASGSAVRTRLGWERLAARTLREECAGAAELGEELCVLVFGADVRVHFGPGDPGVLRARLEGGDAASLELELARGADGASELAGAIAAATPLVLEAGRAPGRLVLFGDGRATGADPLPRLASLAARGTGIEWRPLPAPDRADLALEALELPERCPAGVPLAARAALAWLPGRERGSDRVRVEVELDGPSGVERLVRELAPPPGLVPDAEGRLRWSARLALPACQAGLVRVTVRAGLAGPGGEALADPIPENDTLGADVRVGDAREVVVLASTELARELGPRLAAQPLAGVDFVGAERGELGALLERADALWTLDVAPDALPAEELARFVAEGGGGWLATAGWEFLAGWSAAESTGASDGAARPAALLPLVPAHEVGQPRDVIFVVDGSGSMEGEPFERVREALFQLVPAASPSDRIVLHFFTLVLGQPPAFESTGRTPEERRAELAPLLAARVPRGGTAIGYALDELARSRGRGATNGLVLLLTDGHTQDDAFSAQEVRRKLAAARLDLRVLALGDRPRLDYLRGLLLPGEAIVDVRDLADLAPLLSLEVNRHRVRLDEGLSIVPLAPGGAGGPAAEVVAAQLEAGPPAEWGRPRGYVRAEVRPGAEVAWRSSVEGEPLLALQAVGAGRTAALAFSPGAAWCPGLASRLELLAPLLEVLARGRRSEEARPRLAVEAGELALDGAPLDWPAAVELELRPAASGELGELEPPALGRLTLLPAARPGEDPRRARRAPWPTLLDRLPRGAPLVARVLDPAGGERLALLHLRAPGAPEWAGGERARPGEREDLPRAEPRPVVRPRGPHPWALAVLLAGVLCAGAGALLCVLPGLFGQGIGRTYRR